MKQKTRLCMLASLDGLLFEPEDGGDTFLRNIDLSSPDYICLRIELFIAIIVKT
jgi:hypothetical protein